MEDLEKTTIKNFEKWNESLSQDAESVAENYSEEGELLGTVSSEIRQGKEAIKGYFDHFLKSDPIGKVIERKIIQISDDIYLDGGLYDFELTKDGERKIVNANFTYVWQKEGGDWKILHHHSSAKDATKENETLDLDSDDIEWGTNKEVSEHLMLRTGFHHNPDGSTTRFTYLIEIDDDGSEKVVYSHLSEKPENTGV